jgi:hypothetical protein
MEPTLSFRWLGVQGIELRCGEQSLAIDPFFTRPPLRAFLLLSHVTPDEEQARQMLPACNFILITHSHYDHVMDVPGLALHTRAKVFGSPNTGRILSIYGVPPDQYQVVKAGQRLSLGPFEVEVLAGLHVRLPVDRLINGAVNPRLRPPLRLVDYRMDYPLGYSIEVQGVRILFCPGEPRPADILFTGVDWKPDFYYDLLADCKPALFVPLHWDDFFRPIAEPARELKRPVGVNLSRLGRLAVRADPALLFMIPKPLQWVDLSEFQLNR